MSAALLAFPLARWAARFDRGAVRLRGRLEDGEPVEVTVRFAGGVAVDAEASRALVERLHDPVVSGHADCDRGLLVKVAPGFTARLAPGAVVRVDAATVGPPREPRLAGPLAISVSGDGVVVRLLGATLAVRSGTMSPDGEITLHGDGWLARRVLRLASRHLTREVRRGARLGRVRAFLRAGTLAWGVPMLLLWVMGACGSDGDGRTTDEGCDRPQLAELCGDCPTEEDAAASCLYAGEPELLEVRCEVATVRRCPGHGNDPSELYAWDADGTFVAGAVAPCLDDEGRAVGPGCDANGGWTVFGDPPADLLACIRSAPVDLECFE